MAAGLPDVQLIPTLARKQDEVDSMTVAYANLFVNGHDLDVRTLFTRRRGRRITPTSCPPGSAQAALAQRPFHR
jgi:acyl transferase domain-containing protein